MALAVNVRFDFVDEKGKTSFTKIRVPVGFTLAQYVEFAQAAAAVINSATTCQITGVSLTFGLDTSGWGLNTIVSGLADIYQKFRMQWNTAVAGFKAKFSIPASDESYVIAGSDAVDVSDPGVAAFISAINNGIAVTGGTMTFCDARQHDIVSNQFAVEVHRKKL